MVYGNPHKERIVLNEISMWSGGVENPNRDDASQHLSEIQRLLKEDKNKEDFKKIVKAYQTPEIAKLIEKTNDYPAWEGAK